METIEQTIEKYSKAKKNYTYSELKYILSMRDNLYTQQRNKIEFHDKIKKAILNESKNMPSMGDMIRYSVQHHSLKLITPCELTNFKFMLTGPNKDILKEDEYFDTIELAEKRVIELLQVYL